MAEHFGLDAAVLTALRVGVPASNSGDVNVVDWSADGRYVGITIHAWRTEYWLLQDLQGGR